MKNTVNRHTKGPWRVATAIRTRVLKEGAIEIQDGSPLGSMIALLYPDNWPDNGDAANARLIAAAPELLEALLGVADGSLCFCGGEGEVTGHRAFCEDARDAIAKATGH